MSTAPRITHRTPARRKRSAVRRKRTVRQDRAAVRRRLRNAPPAYLSVTSGGYDDGPAGHNGALADGTALGLDSVDTRRSGTGRRRVRIRLIVAALPLVLASVLFAFSVLGDPAAPAAKDAPVPAAQNPPESVADGRAAAPVTAAVVPARAWPDAVVDASARGGQGDASEVAQTHGAPSPLPTAAPGHRPVAVRVSDPAALSLVGTGHRVDVIGMDGSILAGRLEVLDQRGDRSGGHGTVLVLAVPDGDAPALAAAALSREVTVLRSADSARTQTPP